MDANGSRFHLLQGELDWARCRIGTPAPAFEAKKVEWNADRGEVTLFRKALRFPVTAEPELTPMARRGAARDRFENWYWIAPDRKSILVRSSGSGNTSTFWPATGAEPVAHASDRGDFHAAEVPALRACRLQGLAITEDQYLVAGAEEPGGLVTFDLYSGSTPRQRIWPSPFTPFALSPRSGGGVWILDRDRRSVWELDRRFNVIGPPEATAASDVGGFIGAASAPRTDTVPRHAVPHTGCVVPARDPVSIADAGGGGALVLDVDDGQGFAQIHLVSGCAVRGAPVSTRGMAACINAGEDTSDFTLIAHDFALGARAASDPPNWLARVYVAVTGGNQSFGFGLTKDGDSLGVSPMPRFFPMRLFGGRALVSADGEVWYDSGDDWVKLLEQNRPRFEDLGELWTPVFDSGEPGCVWHRLMLDACIPAGAAVDVYSRASDDWRELTLAEWLGAAELRALGAAIDVGAGPALAEELAAWQAEPAPYLRGLGSELPYLSAETGPDRGTWELLFQQARGRYVQVRLVLRGDGRSTPRIRALRAWYPRFSYLEHYLPAVYREDEQSASFLDRFLANIEGMFTAIEDRIAAAQMLFDVASAPPEALDWLGQWFGVALDPSWEEHRRRLFIRHATEFFAMRGTVRGLQLALRLALDECVDESLFSRPTRRSRQAAPVRIIERFRARHTPPALLGDIAIAVSGPRRIDPGERWQPTLGAAELHRRYRDSVGLNATMEFPIVAPADAKKWSDFAESALGFVPGAAATEQSAWRDFLSGRYASSLVALNTAHAATWPSFEAVTLPANEPAPAGYGADWRRYVSTKPIRERKLWQDFLARRYRNIRALNSAWQTQWSGFGAVSLHDRMSANGPALRDWYQFEAVVMAMHHAAHQFTVMLPVPRNLRTDTPSQQRRLNLAKAVLHLEKPAHTTFDLRFYWAMFRVGEARLGDDTVIDLGSRSPALMSPVVLGQSYLAESFLSSAPGHDAPSRLQLGRDRLALSTRIGGP